MALNFGDILGGLMGLFGGGGGQQQHGSSGGGGPLSLFQNPGQGLAGLGIMGLGQALTPQVKSPNFSGLQNVQNLSNFNSSPHSLDPAIQQSIQGSLNIQNEQQLRNLRDTYKNARPGTDYTTDSAYQRDLANLNRNMSMTGSDAFANATLQSNQQQLGNLTNLAGLDAQKAMTEYGQKSQQAQNFSQGFGNVGSMFLQKGLGIPDYGGLASLFPQGKKQGQ